jgi:hypothetical protein
MVVDRPVAGMNEKLDCAPHWSVFTGAELASEERAFSIRLSSRRADGGMEGRKEGRGQSS